MRKLLLALLLVSSSAWGGTPPLLTVPYYKQICHPPQSQRLADFCDGFVQGLIQGWMNTVDALDQGETCGPETHDGEVEFAKAQTLIETLIEAERLMGGYVPRTMSIQEFVVASLFYKYCAELLQ